MNKRINKRFSNLYFSINRYKNTPLYLNRFNNYYDGYDCKGQIELLMQDLGYNINKSLEKFIDTDINMVNFLELDCNVLKNLKVIIIPDDIKYIMFKKLSTHDSYYNCFKYEGDYELSIYFKNNINLEYNEDCMAITVNYCQFDQLKKYSKNNNIKIYEVYQ